MPGRASPLASRRSPHVPASRALLRGPRRKSAPPWLPHGSCTPSAAREFQEADVLWVRITPQLALHTAPGIPKGHVEELVITFWQLRRTDQPGSPGPVAWRGLLNNNGAPVSVPDPKAEEHSRVSRSKPAMATNTCSSLEEQKLPSSSWNPGGEVNGYPVCSG